MDFRKTLHETPGLLAQLANVVQHPLTDTPILSAKIKLLWQCNLSCVFCELPEPGAPMSQNKVLNILHALRKRGLLKIHYSGGEIFLHPEIFSILETSSALGLQVNITTNGTLLDRKKIRLLSKMCIHSVSVSLDSADAKLHDKLRGRKGAFDATLETIVLLARHGKKHPKLRVNTLVSSENIEQLDQIHTLLRNMSETIHWKLIPVDSVREHFRLTREMVSYLSERTKHWQLLDEPPFGDDVLRTGKFEKDHVPLVRGQYGKRYYSDHRCYMPWLHLFIDPDGFVYPCCMSRGKIAAYGNICQHSLDEILAGRICQEFRMTMASNHTMNICRCCDDFIHENAMIEESVCNYKDFL